MRSLATKSLLSLVLNPISLLLLQTQDLYTITHIFSPFENFGTFLCIMGFIVPFKIKNWERLRELNLTISVSVFTRILHQMPKIAPSACTITMYIVMIFAA